MNKLESAIIWALIVNAVYWYVVLKFYVYKQRSEDEDFYP